LRLAACTGKAALSNGLGVMMVSVASFLSSLIFIMEIAKPARQITAVNGPQKRFASKALGKVRTLLP